MDAYEGLLDSLPDDIFGPPSPTPQSSPAPPTSSSTAEIDHERILRHLRFDIIDTPELSYLVNEVSEVVELPPTLPAYAVGKSNQNPYGAYGANDDDEVNEMAALNDWDSINGSASWEDDPLPPPVIPEQLPRITELQPCSAPTENELLVILRGRALQQGFWLVRSGTDPRVIHGQPGTRHVRIRTVTYGCSMQRRRKYVEDSDRIRAFRSAKTNCPFRIAIGVYDDNWAICDPWTDRQRSKGWHQHNHGFVKPSEVAHARHSHKQQLEMAASLVAAGLPARWALPRLEQEFPDAIPLSPKDIYTIKQNGRYRARLGGTETEVLLAELIGKGELFRGTRDPHSHVYVRACIERTSSRISLTSLVYTTRTARALLLRWPNVLMVDTTYCTNKYHMPLLHIVGVTACNNTFTAGIAFIPTESTVHLRQALQDFMALVHAPHPAVFLTDRDKKLRAACKSVWPAAKNVLCMWHIQNNIKTAATPGLRRAFGNHKINDPTSVWHDRPAWEEHLDSLLKGWRHVVQSRSEQELRDRREEWVKFFSTNRYLEPLEDALHVAQTALDDEGENFVSFHVDRHPHLGQRNNSRLEGMHGVLKKHLGEMYWRRDLLDAVHSLRDHLALQWKRVTATLQSEMRVKVQDRRLLFSNVRNFVSYRSMVLLQPQLAIVTKRSLWEMDRRFDVNGDPLEEPRECTGVFRTSHLLPCAHDIEQRLKNPNGRLEMDDFGKVWRLVSLESMEQLVHNVDHTYFPNTQTGLQDVSVHATAEDSDQTSDANGSDQEGMVVVRNEHIDLTVPEDEPRDRTLDPIVRTAARRTRGSGRGRPGNSQRGTFQGPVAPSGRGLIGVERVGLATRQQEPRCRHCTRRHDPGFDCPASQATQATLATEAAGLSQRNVTERGGTASRRRRRRRQDEDDDNWPSDLSDSYLDGAVPNGLCGFCGKRKPGLHARKPCKKLQRWRQHRGQQIEAQLSEEERSDRSNVQRLLDEGSEAPDLGVSHRSGSAEARDAAHWGRLRQSTNLDDWVRVENERFYGTAQ